MRKAILLVVLLSLAGCATQTYYVSRGPSYAPTADMAQSFFIGGLGQEQELDASGICGGPNKVAKVQSKLEFLDWFIGAITFGLYTPRHAKVYCVR